VANISKTYSGDFTGFIAGKLLNAAGMAKGESNRREVDNLEKAKPGSLFAKALQSEFGGDLYNRTLGNFDPRKNAGETDRSSSKEGRYKAQFKDTPSKTNSDLEDAEKELSKDDDSIPVKNVDAREHISKIIGVGLDVKLIQLDSKIGKITNQVSSVQDSAVQTQKLLVDQNELLGAKFDTILEIFSGQLAYQEKITDEAQVKRRETELEQENDLSTTKSIESIGNTTGSSGNLTSSIFNKFFGRYLKNLRRRVTSKVFGRKGANKPRIRPRRSLGKSSKTGKQVASQIGDKISGKSGAKILSKSGKTAATRGLGKFAKFIPGLNIAVGLGEAAYRFSKGDTVGGIMSLGSAIPIVGWGFTIADISRDLGYDPLNTMPAGQQYERGTNLTKPGMAEVHGTEAIFGKKDRSDMFTSYQRAIDEVGSTLVSSSVSFADAVGMGAQVKSHLKSTGLSFDIVNIPVATKIGRSGKSGPLSSLEDSFTRDIFISRKDQERELEEEVQEQEETDDDTKPDPKNNGGQRRRPSTTLPNGSYASGTWIGAPGDTDGQQTGLNMNLPGGIGTPIYAPIDLIYRSVGTDGMPAVGLNGDADVKGPAGVGFGYYGAYYFEKDGKQYEVMMGHFRDLPYKGSADGDKIPKGTLLGYQGASGRSVSNTNGVYPHISLHVNGVGHYADNATLKWFANGLATGKKSSGPGGGGGGDRSKAFHELSKDEALSSLTPGTNDFIKPGGSSVVSNTAWDNVTDDTLLYVYSDSEGVPTIGYGSAAMRGITFGTKPITVRQAKAWLTDDIKRISNNLSKNIKWWDSMTDDQRTGLIMFEYNAGEGNSYISSKGYPSLVRELEKGNIRAAIPQIQRTGPGQSRIDIEQELLRSGPQQIVGPGIVGEGKVGPGKVGSGIPLFPDLSIQKLIDMTGEKLKESNTKFDPFKNFNPSRRNTVDQLQSNSALMEDMEEDSMVQQVYIINNTIAASPLPPIITSSGRSKDNYVEQYRMAVLGA
jgi:GH24 family phage-related lysozyme (muramidase)